MQQITKTQDKYKISVYVGSDNTTKKINIDYANKTVDIIQKFYNGFTVKNGIGYYEGLQEDNLIIEILTDDIKLLSVMLSELKTTLNQYSFLVDIIKNPNYAFFEDKTNFEEWLKTV